MSCPKCGSGAVYRGKCRECGAMADPRRASAVGLARPPAPALGDEEPEEATLCEKRRPAPAPAPAVRAPPRRPPLAAPAVEEDAEDGDEERTRALPRRGAPAPRRAAPEPEPEPATAELPLPESEDGAPTPAHPRASNPSRASWYAAAGMKVPDASHLPAREESVVHTLTGAVGGFRAAAAVALAMALADGIGAARGLSPVAWAGAALELLAAAMLLRGVASAKALAWLCALWSLAWALMLGLLHGLPLLALLKAVPAACLLGALHAETRALRGGAAAVGLLFALAGLLPAVGAARAPAAAAPVAGGAAADERLGFALRVPETLHLVAGPGAARHLPAPWSETLEPVAVFKSPDGTFAGALLADELPVGIELANLLARIDVGGAAPLRSPRLVPDSLADLEVQGWELKAGTDTVLVVLVRAPDGRAFALFGVGHTTALVRNKQLFHAVAWSLQVRKELEAPEPPER